MQQTIRVCHGSDPGVSHPLAGFLAPLELAGLFRPAAVPGLCSPFRAFPSRSGRAPLVGAAGSLVVLPGQTLVRRPRSCRPGPSPTRATFGRRPWPDPVGARGSLSAPLLARPCGRTPRDTSRSPWTSYAGLTSVRPFRRPRSVLPCASPFTPRDGHPSRGGRCSPGRSRPSRALLPPSPGPSHPPRPEASLLPLAARASRRDARPHGSPGLRALLLACATSAPMLETHDVGWTPRGRPKRPARCPSAVTGLIQPGPCCLLGSSLDSHDLRCRDALGTAPRPRAST
jgi:hypothetical protein